ncbi:MAG: U32 family peptidase, partial [Devosia sp.]
MSSITIGPLYFYWSPQQKQDFYSRIADEAPVSTVYLGEVICSKRIPFFERQLPRVRERLERGGKKVVLSTLSEVTVQHDRRSV